MSDNAVYKRGLDEDIREAMNDKEMNVNVTPRFEPRRAGEMKVLNRQVSTMGSIVQRVEAQAVRFMSQTGSRPNGLVLGHGHKQALESFLGVQIDVSRPMKLQGLDVYWVGNNSAVLDVIG